MALSSLTEAKLPRWIACRSIIENQTSTRFIQDAWVGVKCTITRGLAASHFLILSCLWAE